MKVELGWARGRADLMCDLLVIELQGGDLVGLCLLAVWSPFLNGLWYMWRLGLMLVKLVLG